MSKYGNVKTVRNGITFDSRKEAARYDELMLMLRDGEIENLRLQPEYTIQEAFTMPDGTKVRALRYRADFSYRRKVREGPDIRLVEVVEDVKGYRTKDYEIKKKLLMGRGIKIEEI